MFLFDLDGKFLIVNRMTDEDAERFEDYIISDDQQLILDQLKDPIPVPIPAQKALQISNLVPHQPSTPSAGGRTILVSANKTAEEDIAFAARAAVAATLVSIGTAVVTSPTKKAASPTRKAASSHSTSEIGNNDMYLTQTESSHIQDLQSLLSNEMDPNTQIDETQRETTIDNVDDVDPSAGFELQAVDTSIEDTAAADAIDTETIEKETSNSASPKKRLRPAIILRRSNRIINSESWKKPISYADDTATPKRLRFNSQQTPQPALFMTVERVLDNQPTVDGAAGQILNSATRATDTSPVKAEESLGRIPEVEVEISSVHATSEEDANKDALAMEEDEGQSSSNWLTQPMTQDILHGSEESLMYSSQSETQQLFTQASSASPLQSNLELSCRSPRNKPSNPSSSAKEVRKRKETDSTSGRIMPPDAEFDPYYLNKIIIKQFGNHGLYKGKVLHYRG